MPAENETQNQALKGIWKIIGLSGVVGTHAAMLHTGQVLFFSRPEHTSHRWNPLVKNGLPNDDITPQEPDRTLSTIFTKIDTDKYSPTAVEVIHNPFCSGHTFLADGRLLVAGGDKRGNIPGDINAYQRAPKGTKFGTNKLRVFVPSYVDTGYWKDIGEISSNRWYPTCTLLADGRVMIVSGSIDDQHEYNNQNTTCEIIPPLPTGMQRLHFLIEAWPYHSYPAVYPLPSKYIFLFVNSSTYYLKLHKEKQEVEKLVVKNGPNLNSISAKEPAKNYPNNATLVLLPLLPSEDYAARVLLIGGAGANVYPHWEVTPEAVNLDTVSRVDWLTYDELCIRLGVSPETAEKLTIERNWHTKQDDDGITRVGIQATYEVDALKTCYILNVSSPWVDSQWEPVKSMENPRVMPDAVLLPDGSVLVVNGVTKGFSGGYPGTGPAVPENAVKEAELYDPVINKWTTMTAAACTRLYHSTALLLPDARVLVAGSDHQVNDRNFRNLKNYEPGNANANPRDEQLALAYEYNVEVFEPPYLFKGPRPVLKEVPKTIRYKQLFEIEVVELFKMNQAILQVVLLRPGSVTHNNNMSQRHIGLKIIHSSENHLTVEAPPDGHIAPPGFYMLFFLHDGIPCEEAKFTQLQLECPIDDSEIKLETMELALWLRADSGVLTDAHGHVESWIDLSGQGNDVYWKTATQPGQPESPPVWRPNGLNDKPVIQFNLLSFLTNSLDPVGGCLETSNMSFLPGAGAYSIFLVAHPEPGGGLRSSNGVSGPLGAGGLIGWGDYEKQEPNSVVAFCVGTGPLVQRLPMEAGNASVFTYWDWRLPLPPNGKLMNDPSMSLSFPAAVLLETSYDGTNWRMSVNGRLLKQAYSEGKNTGKGPLRIGRTGSVRPGEGEFFRGDIAEIVVYNRMIETEEREKMQEYFRSRYALW